MPTSAEETRARYDDLWTSQWGDMQRYGPTARHTRRIIERLLSGIGFEDALDVGCGEGSTLAFLHDRFPRARLAGTDVSAAAIDRARTRCPFATFMVADSAVEPIEGSYDLATCFDVLEHVEDDALLLARLARTARRWVLCATVQGVMRPEEATIGHVRNYQRGELAGKMKAAGLTPVRVVEWGFPFYSPIFRSLVSATSIDSLSHGAYGLGRKAVCRLLYGVFLLNSWRKGDRLFILAEKAAPGPTPRGGT